MLSYFHKIWYNKSMEQKKSLKEKLSLVEDFLFDPHICICCTRECDLDNDYRLCSKCVDKLEFIEKSYCLKCGEKIGEGYDFCINCKDNSRHFDLARAVMVYDDISAPIILRFKYNNQKWYKTPLAHLLKDYYKNSDIVIDCVTYVPMPETRQKERGYNQAKELAVEFTKLTNIPLLDLLTRKDDKIRQSTLTKEERMKNIKGSFSAINKESIKGKDILIIDDVLTTGSTASECAKVLKENKARSVSVLTLAKTSRELNFIK